MAIIFVFGSNLAGRHGAGAALDARKNHGAIYGQGVGLQGNSYAVPTKDEHIKTLPYERIEVYVRDFIRFACQHPEHTFNVTPIGTGRARVPVDVMKRMFANAIGLSNVNLPTLFKSSAKVMTKIGIVGSSKAGENNVGWLSDYLAELNPETDTVLSGDGTGVDKMIAREARAKGFNVIEFPPDKQSKEW